MVGQITSPEYLPNPPQSTNAKSSYISLFLLNSNNAVSLVSVSNSSVIKMYIFSSSLPTGGATPFGNNSNFPPAGAAPFPFPLPFPFPVPLLPFKIPLAGLGLDPPLGFVGNDMDS